MPVSYQTILDNAKAALNALILGNVESYTFAGPNGTQTVKRTDIGKLQSLINDLEAKAAQESTRSSTELTSFGGCEP